MWHFSVGYCKEWGYPLVRVELKDIIVVVSEVAYRTEREHLHREKEALVESFPLDHLRLHPWLRRLGWQEGYIDLIGGAEIGVL